MIEFPRGEVTGAGFATLPDLVERDIVTVLDLEFVRHTENGEVVLVDIAEAVADAPDDLGYLVGASTGLLDDEDVAAVGESIDPPPPPRQRRTDMGLLRTAARTAVITRTATRVHGRAQARQQGQWAAQQAAAQAAAPAPPPAAPAPAAPAAPAFDTSAMIEQLTRLGELKTAGVLTEVEFEVQKARILSGA